MNKDHCEDFAGAFVGRVLREHWEGVPWETGRKKGEDQGTWRGPRGRGGGPGAAVGTGSASAIPQRHSHALSCRADPAMLRAFSALEKTLVGSARAP